MMHGATDLALKPEEGEVQAKESEIAEESAVANETVPAQETATGGSKVDSRGEPWIDYYPENLHKKPENLAQRLREHQDNIRQILLVKELFKLRTLEIKIHRSYYWNWVKEANKILVNTVRLRSRLRDIEKKNSK